MIKVFQMSDNNCQKSKNAGSRRLPAKNANNVKRIYRYDMHIRQSQALLPSCCGR